MGTYIEVQQRIDRDKWRERPGLQDHHFGGRSLVEQKRVFGNGEIEIWVFEMNNCFYFSNPPKLSNSASSTSTNTKTHSVSATLHTLSPPKSQSQNRTVEVGFFSSQIL